MKFTLDELIKYLRDGKVIQKLLEKVTGDNIKETNSELERID